LVAVRFFGVAGAVAPVWAETNPLNGTTIIIMMDIVEINRQIFPGLI
jgi:hypothetical protein